MMNTEDKKAWMETHGNTYKGQSLDSNNMYYQWISYNDDWNYMSFMPTVDEAVDEVFKQLMSDLLGLCSP